MPLNLNDRLVVMACPAMQSRLASSVAKYALYLLGGTPTTPQLAWAREAVRSPASVGQQVGYHLLDDTNYLAGGSDITDVQLQGAVETAINARFIQPEE